ncbi:eukaryotic translation initiation factor 2D isoform X2 [Agrilus planipennis]|uniref:Eukaryotic translation initiation factor 2D isoform X2 n=1 Tax=Agrilus planipennis TaxID=224129 RepID=A0A1W4WQ12_AGRPL|nr:eukaryotic translation initiation factor 2D isoform X2 [Agrilus planipennis]
MFRKQFKVKANNQLRSSERKHLIDSFFKHYPQLQDTSLKEIFPKKDNISLLKVETSAGILVDVYLVQKRAVAFKVDNIIFPTIYTLWKWPNLLISFTTHAPVISKLKEGADLMIPGVIFPKGINFSTVYGMFEKGVPASVNTEDNKAPQAVGVTACNSGNMFLNTKGKCLIVYHMLGDRLCTLENLPTVQLPLLQPPDWILNYQNITTVCNESEKSINTTNMINDNSYEQELGTPSNTPIDECNKISESITAMDRLLKNCFFSCIKFSKNIQLPILTSTFYKTCVVPFCPEDLSLDIKKSSYKKLSSFLKEMAELGIITLQEKQPGVDEIVDINHTHLLVQSFEGSKLKVEQVKDKQPVIEEALTVTAAVLPIFSDFNLKKGSVLQKSEVRSYIKEYVKLHNLQNENDPKKVKVNVVFGSLFKETDVVTWEELFQKLFTSMGSCFKIQNSQTEVVQKGKLDPIVLSVAIRTGNKKVTLVDNLEIYGINIENFAKECQQNVAASTSINTIKGKKSRQLLVQGNQIVFITSHLQNKYKIPKKYISGTENAPKKKK